MSFANELKNVVARLFKPHARSLTVHVIGQVNGVVTVNIAEGNRSEPPRTGGPQLGHDGSQMPPRLPE
jgi:hypothetical protein